MICFAINNLGLTTSAADDKTYVHTVMLFLTLTLIAYHVGLSLLGNQGWRWSVTTSKLSYSKIKISSKQPAMQQCTLIHQKLGFHR
jgi:hypothetical protein